MFGNWGYLDKGPSGQQNVNVVSLTVHSHRVLSLPEMILRDRSGKNLYWI